MCPNEWTDAAIFLALLGDASSLAHLVAEVVQLGATDATMTDDLELGDLGAVKREGTLDTDTEGNLADGEGLTGTGAGHADDVTLENLDALAVAFLNAVVNLDVVGNADLRDVLADLLSTEIGRASCRERV